LPARCAESRVNLADVTNAAESISFSSSTFATAQTITLTQGQLELSDAGEAIAITGPATGVTVSGAGSTRVFQVDSGVTATMTNLDVTNGSLASGNGAGINNNGGTLTLNGCTVSGNSVSSTGRGGGISNNGTLNLTGCTVSNNTANGDSQGGGLENGSGSMTIIDSTISGNTSQGYAGYGGGGMRADGGTVTIQNSTLSGNSANASTSGGGGAILAASTTLNLDDCTFYGNTADAGGAVKLYQCTTTIVACTFTQNSAAQQGGAIEADGQFTLQDTILSGNTSPDVPEIICSGALPTSGGHNLIDIPGFLNSVSSDVVGVPASLGTLGNYGGPTQTVPLLPGSPGIGAGARVSGITTDQRGLILPSPSSAVSPDIGAFQSQLVVESASGSIATGSATLTLPGAVSLADNYSVSSIGFDAQATFANAQTITLTQGQLELSDAGEALAITGPAAGVTISGGGSTRVFQVDTGVTATLTNLDITKGSGDGFLNFGTLALNDCTVSKNTISGGGGAGIDNIGTLSLAGCTVSDNTAQLEGGGLLNAPGASLNITQSTFSGNVSNASSGNGGGGILVSGGGSVTIQDSTLSGNSDSASGGIGGAILALNTANLTLEDCTLDGNSATVGGAVYSYNTEVTIIGCTFTQNHASSSAGALYMGWGSLQDAILSGDTAPLAPEIFGSPASNGNNVVDKTDNRTAVNWLGSDRIGVPASLGTLGNYGGPTQTVPELPGSPTLTQGVSVTGVTTDQRGFRRSTNGTVDIGAFQNQLSLTSTVNPQNVSVGITVSFAGQSALATVTDPTSPPTLTDTIAWGDGTTTTSTWTVASASWDVEPSHAYAHQGAYTVTVTVSDPDADAAQLTFKQQVVATNATIAVTPYSVTYDGNPHAAAGTATGFEGVNLAADLNLGGTTHTSAGTTTDTWTFHDPNGDYTDASGTITDVINQATPSITWNPPAAITYGTPVGATQLDASANVPGTFVYTPGNGTEFAPGSAPLSLTFTPSDTVDYTTASATNSLTVLPAPLTVTANPQTKVYGQADPALTYTVSGLQYQDSSAGVLSGRLTRAAGEHVLEGPYAISQGTLAADPNYSLTFVGSTLTITPAPLAITIGNDSQSYGAPANLYADLPATVDTGVQGEDLALIYYFSPGDTDGAAAGTYPIEGDVGDGTGLTSDYNPTFIPGNLTVTPDNTQTTVNSSQDPSTFLNPVTFTATVADSTSGLPTPTGNVQFVIDGNNVGAPVPLSSTGTADLAASLSTFGGPHTVQAIFQPSPANFATSNGALSGGQTVNVPATRDTFVFTPDASLPVLDITLNGSPDGTLAAGGTIMVSGGSGINQVEIDGVNQVGTGDAFTINDTAVTYNTPGFAGTVINFASNIVNRDVYATAGNATFTIVGPGTAGPGGNLFGGDGGDDFVFANGAHLRGNIDPTSGAGNTLDLSAYTTGVSANLVAGSASPVEGLLLGDFGTLLGGSGNDVLTANNTGVTLVGSAGTNTLTGGPTDRVVEAAAGGATLTDAKLTFGPITEKLSGITTVNLTDTGSGHNTFTVSGWTGTGGITGTAETAVATKSAGFTLANSALSSTDGMSLTISGFSAANLRDTKGGQLLTLNGWSGSGKLEAPFAAPDTLAVTEDGGYTLTNTSLTSCDSLSMTIAHCGTANLTDTGSGHVFTISGWTGGGSLTGKSETLTEAAKAGYTLSNAMLTTTPGKRIALSGFTTVNLTDTGGGNTFNVTGWTGGGTLAGTETDIVSATKDGNVALSNVGLSSTGDGMELALSGFKSASLTASPGNVNLDVSGWTGNVSLTGGAGVDTVVALKPASMTLTNTALTATDGLHGVLSRIAADRLGVDTSAPSGNETITASSYTGTANLTAYGSGDATLLGGLVNGSLTIAPGDTGNNILIGGYGPELLTDQGAGRNLMIGGFGADTLTGSGNDILISGTTSYDSNLTALDAILAEWSSSDSYATRIGKIESGIVVGWNRYALNSSTVHDELGTDLIQDGTGATGDWFIVNPRDTVASQAGEEVDVF
jgi:predicted outer membrane repeat protein